MFIFEPKKAKIADSLIVGLNAGELSGKCSTDFVYNEFGNVVRVGRFDDIPKRTANIAEDRIEKTF